MIKWKERTSKELAPELVEKYQLKPIAAKLFALRNLNTAEKLEYWLNATEEDLADPNLMHDMAKAVARINLAIEHNEKITIYGDYDADGITATAIMMETLEILGADVHYFIPNRFEDGYGPNLAAYKKIVANGTNLIITVDNGITGVEEVAYAKHKGVDTIITDHHKMQENVPDCYALVHCNYPGQKYPFDDYCGAGVAYTICRELMQDPMPELLELAMIGTIGDMVKISGEGHIVVKRGLEVLNQTDRPGLKALIKNSGLQSGQIDENDVGFNITPRLNAVGRLDNASLAVELLLCESEAEAQKIADKIENLNEQRKDLTAKVYKACLQQVKVNNWQSRKTLVIYSADFHEGVLGLVANKIAEELHKPTIILTKNKAGIIKGSGRSVANFNIFNALDSLKQNLFLKFGGHDFACGLSMEESKIATLRTEFEASYDIHESTIVKYYDFELPFTHLSLDIMHQINQVGPYGTDNVKPIFSISNLEISSCFFMGKDKNHIKLTLSQKNNKLEVVGFNKKYITKGLLPYINQLFIQLGENNYRNQVKLQGIIEGIVFSAPKFLFSTPVIDLRQEKHVMGFADRYLLFDKQNLEVANNSFDIDSKKITLIDEYDNDSDREVVVFLDTPHNQAELDQALTKNYKQLYLRFLLDQLPIKLMPAKKYFEVLLKYVYQHPGLEINEYRQVAPFLGIDYQNILFIMRVFYELKFITIKQNKIWGIKNPEKKALTASKYFCAIQSQLNFIQQLRQMPSEKLLMYVNQQLKNNN